MLLKLVRRRGKKLVETNPKSAIGRTVRQLREERGWNLRELAEKVGWDYSVLARKERGEVGIRPREREEVAKAFGLTLDEFDLRWRATVPMGHGHRPPPTGIPVLNRAPAGVVIDYGHAHYAEGEFHAASTYIDRGDIDDPFAFALIIVGDSMVPELLEGETGIFSPSHVPSPRYHLKPGDIVVVWVGNGNPGGEGCTVGYWQPQPDGRIAITKANPRHPTQFFESEDVLRVGVLIETRRKRKG